MDSKIDLVDLTELEVVLGDVILKEFFDAFYDFVKAEDGPFDREIKQTFIKHQFIALIKSLKA